MSGTDSEQNAPSASSVDLEAARLRAALEQVRNERDEVIQKLRTVEGERDVARRQSNEYACRYHRDLHAAHGRIVELDQLVRRQGAFLGLASIGLVGSLIWKLK